jgi:hypothetical protein
LAIVPWKKLRPGNSGSLTDISYDPGGWPAFAVFSRMIPRGFSWESTQDGASHGRGVSL